MKYEAIIIENVQNKQKTFKKYHDNAKILIQKKKMPQKSVN